MLVIPHAYNAIYSVDKTTPRIMIMKLLGNQHSIVISCYSPTNVSDELETGRLYIYLTSLTRQIPNHNILIIGGDFNAQLG